MHLRLKNRDGRPAAGIAMRTARQRHSSGGLVG
jgi:hypothetical protein